MKDIISVIQPALLYFLSVGVFSDNHGFPGIAFIKKNVTHATTSTVTIAIKTLRAVYFAIFYTFPLSFSYVTLSPILYNSITLYHCKLSTILFIIPVFYIMVNQNSYFLYLFFGQLFSMRVHSSSFCPYLTELCSE